MKKEIEQFYSLFENSPNSVMYHINNGCDDIKNIVGDLIVSFEAKLDYQELNDLAQKKFRLTNRNYEYVIVTDCLNSVENIDRFISTLYHSLENSAFIIVLSKKENNDTSFIIELLDKANFRAINDIDIFENYNLIMGKKLHMWGAGQ